MRVLVVGVGPAGATAVIQAVELGADVTLLEAEQVGGPTSTTGRRRSPRYAHDNKDIAWHPRHNGIELADHLGPVRFTDRHTVAVGGADTGCQLVALVIRRTGTGP
jgi:glycine/D-amino acid oxidase-like deaminating enzyme